METELLCNYIDFFFISPSPKKNGLPFLREVDEPSRQSAKLHNRGRYPFWIRGQIDKALKR